MIGNIIGGVLIILIGFLILPVVTQQIYIIQNSTTFQNPPTATTLSSNILSIVVGIGIAYSAFRTAFRNGHKEEKIKMNRMMKKMKSQQEENAVLQPLLPKRKLKKLK